ncbi:transcriptional regulator [Streptomyces sp. BRA346]|uniref:transcriptional regulator n=1 Tax=Streptomyces sp. BRA346 TaxID=2878199 RepID=UPI004063B1C7
MSPEPASEVPQQPKESALGYWFRISGFTKRGLALAVTKKAAANGYPDYRPDGSRVRGWLSGEQPKRPDLLAAVLSERIGRTLSAADLGLAAPEPDDLTHYRGPVETLADLGRASTTGLARQTSAGDSTGDQTPPIAPYASERLLLALDSWAYAQKHVLPGTTSTAGRRLGRTDVIRIADYTRHFRELDNKHGGGATLHPATAQLVWATNLLRHGRYTEPDGRALWRELADLAGCVGWMSHDAAQWPAAIRYLTLAVHAARESGDPNLTAHLLQCLARIWGYLNRPDLAADCIALAIYGTRNTAHPVLRAGLYALAARFDALRNRSTDALRNVHQAQEIFHEEAADELPPYGTYLDWAELSSTLGEVMLFLARAARHAPHAATAVGMLNTAAAQRDAARARSRTFDAVASARALLVVGDYEAACASGHQALSVGTTVDSARIRRRFRDLAREAEGHDSAAVRDLREQLLATGDHH